MLDFQQLTTWLLIFTRMASFIAVAPFFSVKGVPVLAKAGLAVFLTIATASLVPEVASSSSAFAYTLELVRETVVGLSLGFTANMIFQAVKIGGELIDLQMGFAMANIFDPFSGSRVTLMGQFQYYYATLLFLVLNGHHSLILAMVKSYQIVPLAGAQMSGLLVEQMLNIFVGMFAIALKIAVPVMAVLIISDISLGLVARTVPQLNVFILGFPVKAALGMLVVALILPLLAETVAGLVTQMEKDLLLIMGSFS